ncbi:dnaJ chaperone-like protein [Westerdykella ornata]|uniref:DnaJ chaperone-like protein n=1 Tax=Westerdykella ornata TaxID=318751 RepID=A0A6A6JWF5_WESOR|nr:dnaJ chaperone-like protein [Westerdykella ornata]KAF2280941.1 dnaJ chaperone-like protein [Westerdykella ornata]
MSGPPVDYYKVLEVDPKATQQQIRDAYKKAALKHHPDRVPQDSPERRARTKRFQQINDAYYTLSDPTRRREYDATRSYHSFTGAAPSFTEEESTEGEIPRASTGGFPWSAFGFGGAPGGTTEESHTRFSNEQFGSMFEEMLREEGMAEGERAVPTGRFWSIVGGLSGGAMGFIVANFPGMVAGAVAGNRLGAVRDAKGKSVYQVFQELPQADKARLLSELAAKVFSSAVGS